MSAFAASQDEAFLRAMRLVTSPVALVVCEVDDQPWGVTVSSFSCVSVAPPTVMIALGATSVAARAIVDTGRFSVSLLSDEQVDLARFGARGGTPKFLRDSAFGLAKVEGLDAPAGALCALACDQAEAREIEDHVVFTARVIGVEQGRRSQPLLYGDRQFRRLGTGVSG